MLIRFFRYLRKKYWYYKALRTLGGRKPDGIHVGGKVIFTNTTLGKFSLIIVSIKLEDLKNSYTYIVTV